MRNEGVGGTEHYALSVHQRMGGAFRWGQESDVRGYRQRGTFWAPLCPSRGIHDRVVGERKGMVCAYICYGAVPAVLLLYIFF